MGPNGRVSCVSRVSRLSTEIIPVYILDRSKLSIPCNDFSNRATKQGKKLKKFKDKNKNKNKKNKKA